MCCYWQNSDGACIACNAGTYKTSIFDSLCTLCVAGTYKATPGPGTCLDCPAHSLSPAGSTSETTCTCNAGFWGFTYPNTGTCKACSAGTYQSFYVDFWGNTIVDCHSCPTNTHSYAASRLAGDCLCKAGYSGPSGGACTACAAGKYNAVPGAQTCTLCALNTYSEAVGAVSSDTCTSCPTGSVTNWLGADYY